MPPEVGSVYEYTGQPSLGDACPGRFLALASWSEHGQYKAIFVALDQPKRRGWWTNVWYLDLVTWSKNWSKCA